MASEGGETDGVLAEERNKSSFDVETMTHYLDGGEKYTAKRRWILSSHADVMPHVHAEKPREDQVAYAIKHFMDVHKDHLGHYIPKDMDMSFMSDARMTSSALTINFGVFSSTLRAQCSDQQKQWWLDPAQTGKIIGCYAQTELSHGSNVRGLSTIATFDPDSDEWIINTPTTGATKWWSTGMPCATHAAVFAQLVTKGKNYGLHTFMVQLRRDDLKPLPGVEVGDIGTMLGENDSTIGFARFTNVRIPRRHLMEKRQHVTRDGEYVKGPHPGSMKTSNDSKDKQRLDDKMLQALKYITMMKTRIAPSQTAAGALAKGCTIAARYSCVRHQGFKDKSGAQTYDSPENQIIDYNVQRYRVLKWIATTYAMRAATQWMLKRRHEVERNKIGGEIDVSDLPEVHATGAGLKALCCCMAADGIEDLRRACGGHGFLMSSGIAPLEADFKGPNTTAEGDFVLLSLQTARFLMKSLQSARRGEPLSGLTQCLAPFKDAGFNPAISGREYLNLKKASSVDDFLDHQFLLKLFELRTMIAIHRCGKALDESQEQGLSLDDARNLHARLLYTTVKSHVRYFILSKFSANLEMVEDPACQVVLKRLCALFGICDILEGEQWLGIIDSEEAELAELAARTLGDYLRPDVVALTDAFDFPDRVLNSALGRNDGNVYEALLEAARESTMNVLPDGTKNEVPKFMKELEPYLDTQLLKLANKRLPSSKL